jgi:hypothetical protein
MTMKLDRRTFLGAATAAAATPGASLFSIGQAAETAPAALPTLIGNRFLTFNTVIRVNQIEAGRDQDIGADESADHTPDRVQTMRDAFGRGCPDGRMTWAFSWRALQDRRDNYKAIRELVRGFHEKYGDEITFFVGGYFANMYNTRAQVNRDLHDGLAMVSAMVGGGYRPRSVLAGYLAAENQQYLAEKEGIHVCQGNIWSQYAVDNGDGDGSICYPYYPSREHFCKPAQRQSDFIDCVNLDGWTCDFVSARRTGLTAQTNSRMGVGPIETVYSLGVEVGLREMLATTAAHFDQGFALNRFAWVTDCWEVCLLNQRGGPTGLTEWLSEVRRRWPKTLFVTQGEFGMAWREHFKNNTSLDYRFTQRGSGIHGSDENLEIRWFMNKDFRLALLRDWRNKGEEMVIDFTRYDLPAAEPKGKGRNWSLMNRINQKQTRPQDKPLRLTQLAAAEQAMIRRRYPELFRD